MPKGANDPNAWALTCCGKNEMCLNGACAGKFLIL